MYPADGSAKGGQLAVRISALGIACVVIATDCSATRVGAADEWFLVDTTSNECRCQTSMVAISSVAAVIVAVAAGQNQ
jgi:hypothetical protein